jgi:hypothetical protein
MTTRSKFVIVPLRKAALAVERVKPKPQNRSVEHVVYGVDNLLHVRPLDDGSLVAVVTFNGVDRTIRLSAAFWVTDIAEIMKLAPHLTPPPAPKVLKKMKASAVPDEADDEGEPESAEASGDGQDDAGPSEATWP